MSAVCPLRGAITEMRAAPQIPVVIFAERLRTRAMVSIKRANPGKLQRAIRFDFFVFGDQKPPLLNIIPLDRPVETVVPHRESRCRGVDTCEVYRFHQLLSAGFTPIVQLIDLPRTLQ